MGLRRAAPLRGFHGRGVLVAFLWAACTLACAPATDSGPNPEADAARELAVVTSGGFAAAYDILAPRFESERGIRLSTAYGASSGGATDSIPVRLERGEVFDVVILSRPSLDNMITEGFVRPHEQTDLVRSSIGMAVRKGVPAPDIGTPEAFIHAVLGAESIGYSASASGTYLSTELFPKLDIWDRIESKSRRIESERVASVVARGGVQIGFQQVSEILPIDGAEYVGPIPDAYQRVTTFSIGITASSGNLAAARQLMDFLASEAVAATIAATGLEPIVLEH